MRPRHLRQRIQLDAFVEACSGHCGEVGSEGFATGGGAFDRALVFAGRVGSRRRERRRPRSDKLSFRSDVRSSPRLRVQLLIDRLAPEDRRGFLRERQQVRSSAIVSQFPGRNRTSAPSGPRKAQLPAIANRVISPPASSGIPKAAMRDRATSISNAVIIAWISSDGHFIGSSNRKQRSIVR